MKLNLNGIIIREDGITSVQFISPFPNDTVGTKLTKNLTGRFPKTPLKAQDYIEFILCYKINKEEDNYTIREAKFLKKIENEKEIRFWYLYGHSHFCKADELTQPVQQELLAGIPTDISKGYSGDTIDMNKYNGKLELILEQPVGSAGLLITSGTVIEQYRTDEKFRNKIHLSKDPIHYMDVDDYLSKVVFKDPQWNNHKKMYSGKQFQIKKYMQDLPSPTTSNKVNVVADRVCQFKTIDPETYPPSAGLSGLFEIHKDKENPATRFDKDGPKGFKTLLDKHEWLNNTPDMKPYYLRNTTFMIRPDEEHYAYTPKNNDEGYKDWVRMGPKCENTVAVIDEMNKHNKALFYDSESPAAFNVTKGPNVHDIKLSHILDYVEKQTKEGQKSIIYWNGCNLIHGLFGDLDSMSLQNQIALGLPPSANQSQRAETSYGLFNPKRVNAIKKSLQYSRQRSREGRKITTSAATVVPYDATVVPVSTSTYVAVGRKKRSNKKKPLTKKEMKSSKLSKKKSKK